MHTQLCVVALCYQYHGDCSNLKAIVCLLYAADNSQALSSIQVAVDFFFLSRLTAKITNFSAVLDKHDLLQ